jgi:hypothetical protein
MKVAMTSAIFYQPAASAYFMRAPLNFKPLVAHIIPLAPPERMHFNIRREPPIRTTLLSSCTSVPRATLATLTG